MSCVCQVKKAHCAMALWLTAALRASLKHTKELTMLSLRRGSSKAKMLPSTPSSITKMTSVSTETPTIAFVQAIAAVVSLETNALLFRIVYNGIKSDLTGINGFLFILAVV